jgi:hypothetical protein
VRRDSGDPVITWLSGTPAIVRGLVVGCASSPCRARCGGRQDLARVEGDDGDLLHVDDGQDPPADNRRTDLEVVQAVGPPQVEGALAVGDVVAEAEVAWGAAPGRVRLDPGGVGRGRRAAAGLSARRYR